MDQIKDHPLYRKHNIDSAMNSLWEFYRSRFIALFLISLVMSGIIQYATTFIDFSEIKNLAGADPSSFDPDKLISMFRPLLIPMVLLTVVSLLFSTILHYYILHNPVESDSTIVASILKSLKYFIPYLIIIVFFVLFAAFAILLGLMVLIIGVFFSIAYVALLSFFILPVMMVEENDIGRTMVRTIRLSHSSFWSNLGWTVVFIILYLIISMVLSGIVLIPFTGSFIKTFANPQDTSTITNLSSDPLFIILSSAVNALTLPLFPIFAYILYFNARAREDTQPLITTENQDQENRVRVEDLYAKPRDEENS
jgi:hypothetical protein